MYPSIIILYKYFPEHLGVEWLDGYKQTRDKRVLLKKTEPEIAEGLKLSLNGGGFGKTNEEFSWMYDPLVTFQTTITGQFALLLLIEMLQEKGFKVISANTDGVTSIVNKDRVKEFRKIYKEWEKITFLEMEEAIYQKYVRRDVNNYIVLKNDGSFKYKGAFDYNREPHKNHSMMIVPIALEQYFFKNKSVEEVIKNHENIFDFCKAVKATGDSYLELWSYNKGELNKQKVQKTCRYYVSNTNDTLMKCMPPLEEKIKNENQLTLFDFINDVKEEIPREHNIEKGYNVQLFNQSFLSNDYNINYDYYINECNKIVNVIENENN